MRVGFRSAAGRGFGARGGLDNCDCASVRGRVRFSNDVFARSYGLCKLVNWGALMNYDGIAE